MMKSRVFVSMSSNLTAAVDAGVVVQDVNLAVGLDHVRRPSADLLEVADVALAVVGFQAGLLELFGGGRNSVRQVNEDDGRTVLGPDLCAAKADALAAPVTIAIFPSRFPIFLFSFMHCLNELRMSSLLPSL